MKDWITSFIVVTLAVGLFYLGVWTGSERQAAASDIQCVQTLLDFEKTKGEIKKNASETTRNNASSLNLLSMLEPEPSPGPSPSPTPRKEKLDL